jgi:enoyl-CoA hydratase
MPYIRYEEADGVGIATFSRPEARNALSIEAVEESIGFFTELGERIGRREGPRALLLTGAGKAFVAGADVKEMAEMDRDRARRFSLRGNYLMSRIESLPVPVIAAVNGYALGGGLELALAADFIYAAADARLGAPELSLGLMPGFGGIRRLCLRVGLARAKALVFSASPLGAEEALGIGLVDKVTAPGELAGLCLRAAREFLRSGPAALGAAKLHARECLSLGAEACALVEAERFGALFEGVEPAEGLGAFLGKRRPSWALDAARP